MEVDSKNEGRASQLGSWTSKLENGVRGSKGKVEEGGQVLVL